MDTQKKIGFIAIIALLMFAIATNLNIPTQDSFCSENYCSEKHSLIKSEMYDQLKLQLIEINDDLSNYPSCWFKLWVQENNGTSYTGRGAKITDIYIEEKNTTHCEILKDICLAQSIGAYCVWEEPTDRSPEPSCSCYWYNEAILEDGRPIIVNILENATTCG